MSTYAAVAASVGAAALNVAGGYSAKRSLDVQARNVRAASEEEANRQRRLGALRIGAQRAAFGKAGVDVGAGSPLDVMSMTAQAAQQEAYRVREEGRIEAEALRQEGRSTLVASIGSSLGKLGSILGYAHNQGLFRKKPPGPT